MAQLGNGKVAPNPMVGAVLVYNDTIIGEGFHEVFGGAHAEVNCLQNVAKNNLEKIEHATLYVNLEPCNHYGKTPPCTDLIIKNKIKKVVIGGIDQHQLVAGSGIKKLNENGIDTIVGVLEAECMELNAAFFTFHTKKRPFITLKWAESNDGFMGKKGENIRISNSLTQRHAHQLRTQNMAILVGKNTVLVDNPILDTRFYLGNNPIICVIDSNLEIPLSKNIFQNGRNVFVYNLHKNEINNNVVFVKLNNSMDFSIQICQHLYEQKVISLLVEGGKITLQHFIDSNLWDQAFVYQSPQNLTNGIQNPIIKGLHQHSFYLEDNKVEKICNTSF